MVNQRRSDNDRDSLTHNKDGPFAAWSGLCDGMLEMIVVMIIPSCADCVPLLLSSPETVASLYSWVEDHVISAINFISLGQPKA